jgi:TrmH family RNA methyltransferase
MQITSVQNETIKFYSKLHQKKYRKKEGLFLVEGYHLYEEAKKAGVIKKIFTTDENITGEEVVYVSEKVFSKLAGTIHPQGVVCVCEIKEDQTITNSVLLLDHLQDPGNVGTLLRSALAFGFETVILDETVDLYNDKVLRSTQGAIFKLHIHFQTINEFMDNHPDYTYYGTAMNGKNLKEIEPSLKTAIILGNEGNGVEKNLLDRVDEVITIPMNQTESLNVGVAGSIIMYHLRRL